MDNRKRTEAGMARNCSANTHNELHLHEAGSYSNLTGYNHGKDVLRTLLLAFSMYSYVRFNKRLYIEKLCLQRDYIIIYSPQFPSCYFTSLIVPKFRIRYLLLKVLYVVFYSYIISL
jgi:hypothetical protein